MQSNILSPDGEVFSTPPTTPALSNADIRPSLSRRSSRPSSIHTEYSRAEWTPDVVLDVLSPKKSGESASDLTPVAANVGGEFVTTPQSQAVNSKPVVCKRRKSMDSPCFVHSHLNKDTLAGWMRPERPKLAMGVVGVAPSIDPNDALLEFSASATRSASGADSPSVDGDEFGGDSLTKKLADTAVGVREMSKQLGQSLGLLPDPMVSLTSSCHTRSRPCSIQYPECIDHN
jgi:NAD+ kinase